MKLHTIDRQGTMPDRHDLTAAVRGRRPGIDLKLGWQRRRVDYQTVITSRLKRRGQPGEQPSSVVLNLIDLPMHQLLCPNNLATKQVTLIQETNHNQKSRNLKILRRVNLMTTQMKVVM